MTKFTLKIERVKNGYIITAGENNIDTQKLVVEVGIDDIPKYKIAAWVGCALLNAIEFNNGSHILYVENMGDVQYGPESAFGDTGKGHIVMPDLKK